MKTAEIKGQEYIYYTPEEAKEKGIEYVENWRKNRPKLVVGAWLLTDDGWVVPILKIQDFKKSQGVKAIRIPPGTYLTASRTPMTIIQRKSLVSFVGKAANYKDPNRKISRAERRYIAAWLGPAGYDVQEAFAFASNADPTKRHYKHLAYALHRRANVQQKLDEGLRIQLDRAGMTEKWIAEGLMRLVDNDEKSTPAIKLDALKFGAKILRMITEKTGVPTAALLLETKEIDALQKEREGRDVSSEALGTKPGGDEAEALLGHGDVREVPLP